MRRSGPRGLRRHRSGRGALAAALAVGAALALVAGCSDDTTSGRPAALPTLGSKIAPDLRTLITQQLAAENLTPEVREILQRAAQSGQIDPADYEAAFQRYAKCIRDAGLVEDYAKQPNGLYKVTPRDGTTSKEVLDRNSRTSEACGIKHLAVVEGLYNVQLNNPDLLADANEVVARCLVKAGQVPSDFTGAQFAALVERNFEEAPFDLANTQVQSCLSASGMAVAGAS